MPNVSDDQMERLGKLADSLDAGLYPLRIPIPDAMAVTGMAGIMRDTRDDIVKLVIEITGKNPWEDNPLEG